MSLTDVITSFSTGTYTVTRTAAGSVTTGRYTAGAQTTFSIVACVQPVSGRDLRSLPEGERADDVRELDTVTALFARTPAQEPDLVTIGGEPWMVVNVQLWESFGETHYHCRVSRRTIP